MRFLPTIGLTAALFLAAACATAADAPPPPLDGRTFISQSATGIALVPGSVVRLTFQGGRLGASAGCNQLSGPYAIVEGRLTVGPFAGTEMGCEEPLMRQDQWLAGFLPGATATLAGDTLTLATDGATLTLADEEVVTPDRPLEGTEWVVTGITSGDAVSSTPAGTTASLRFDAGTLTVDAGCNSGGGTYTAAGDTITFGPIAHTMRACAADGAMALEAAVLATLQGEAAYAIDADTLTLTHGRSGLTLDARP